MKKLIFALTVLIGAVSVNAQDRGYRGSVDLGYTAGIGDFKFDRTEISTTHGYQANPYFFIGGGLGVHFMSSYESPDMLIPLDVRDAMVSIPVYGAIRGTFSKGKVSPFVALRLGSYVTNNDGFYGNLSAGVRFKLTGNQSLNLSLGYTSEQLEMQTFDRFLTKWDLSYSRYPRKQTCEGITFKLGYEF